MKKLMMGLALTKLLLTFVILTFSTLSLARTWTSGYLVVNEVIKDGKTFFNFSVKRDYDGQLVQIGYKDYSLAELYFIQFNEQTKIIGSGLLTAGVLVGGVAVGAPVVMAGACLATKIAFSDEGEASQNMASFIQNILIDVTGEKVEKADLRGLDTNQELLMADKLKKSLNEIPREIKLNALGFMFWVPKK